MLPTQTLALLPVSAVTRSGNPLVGPRVPNDPNNADPFYIGEDFSEYVVVDELQYPVPAGIDRRPGMPKQASNEAYSAIDPNE